MVKCPCPASTWSQGCHNFRAVDIGWCRFHLAPVYSNQQIFWTFGCVHQWMGSTPKWMVYEVYDQNHQKTNWHGWFGIPQHFFANLHLTRTIFQAIAFGADCIALQPFINCQSFYLSIHVRLHPTKLIYRYLDRTSNLRKNVNGIWMECEWLKDMKGIWSQIFYAMPRLSRLRQSISGSALVRRMQTDNQVPCRASILGIKQLHAYSILLHTRWFQALILLPSWLRNALSISKGYCSATSVIGNQFQIPLLGPWTGAPGTELPGLKWSVVTICRDTSTAPQHTLLASFLATQRAAGAPSGAQSEWQ